MNYPKRLIEVDLPIKRISAHARREKSIRHGHISTLHIWWARRPLAACRAVICAALWPDPADEHCPPAFRQAAAETIQAFAEKVTSNRQLAESCHPEAMGRWMGLTRQGNRLDAANPAHLNLLRFSLLDFIADFANWDNSTVPVYLETARALTQAAHEALGGAPGTRPLVVDPFAGGGSIPLEALRVGADAFASDLNPVAVLLNKVVLEYIPRYGQRLADEVRKWGQWIKEQAEKELSQFYPPDPDGATPIAYLWARTIRCEGPGCGAEMPLMRSLWLAKKGSRSVALRIVPDQAKKRVEFQIIEEAKAKDVAEGTVRRGSGTCPVCGYTTPVESVRRQLKERHGGAADARLLAVVTTRPGQQGRLYRLAEERDIEAVRKAAEELERRKAAHQGPLSLVPDETISLNEIRRISVPLYGMSTWGDLFSPRQALSLTGLSSTLINLSQIISQEPPFYSALICCLALAFGRQLDYLSSLVTWTPGGEFQGHTYQRQALPLVTDYAEGNPFADASGNWSGGVEWIVRVLGREAKAIATSGQARCNSATEHPLLPDTVDCLFTDPPYYDAVPYAYLSDYFYVWFKRVLAHTIPEQFQDYSVPKDQEIVVDRPHKLSNTHKDIVFYERELTSAFSESSKILRPDGIGVIVFASKTTASWEAILQAVIDAGWIITASWPVDTEREARISAQGQARLASSVHLVCRPRENPDGSLIDEIGDWREVLSELPRRIHEWMPRLAQEGVVGADAIFACLGPALEVFSRYSRVEKASGEVVPLREYLEQVWAAVAKEALNMIFAGADASGFEEDARLTAMWLWTLSTEVKGGNGNGTKPPVQAEEDDEEASTGKATGGLALEYDAARKIAQGLGAHLEALADLVEVKGESARLLPVAERARALFGRQGVEAPKKKKKAPQGLLFAELVEAEEADGGWGALKAPKLGDSVLDRLHQAMLLFAAARGEALKRFLVDDGAGKDQRFWRLAQALSALYPAASEEKRWVDGVLARKKGLGL